MKKRRTNPALADKENPNWTKSDFAKAKRVEDVPALAQLSKRRPGERGPQKAPTKKAISIRLDQDVIEHYRGKGDGWQREINKDLRSAAKLASTQARNR